MHLPLLSGRDAIARVHAAYSLALLSTVLVFINPFFMKHTSVLQIYFVTKKTSRTTNKPPRDFILLISHGFP